MLTIPYRSHIFWKAEPDRDVLSPLSCLLLLLSHWPRHYAGIVISWVFTRWKRGEDCHVCGRCPAFFGDGDSSLRPVKKVIKDFGNILGFDINWGKSALLYRVSRQGMEREELPLHIEEVDFL